MSSVPLVRRQTRPFDALRVVTAVLSLLAAATIVGLFFYLLVGSIAAFRHEGHAFVTGNHWSYRKQFFQAAAMLYGTAVVSSIALILAAPPALLTALFASEVCPPRIGMWIKFGIEMLAGIPSVVYGLLGVLFLRDWMSALFSRLSWDADSGDTLLTAGVLLAVMILPTMMTLADDAFRSVPFRQRDAARALGLTRSETILMTVVPSALPGLVGAVLLSLGRALGETIAVFLVVGRADNRLPAAGHILHSLIEAGQTITSKLGGAETNIAVGDPLHSSAMLALAFVLFTGVLVLSGAASRLRSRAGGEVA